MQSENVGLLFFNFSVFLKVHVNEHFILSVQVILFLKLTLNATNVCRVNTNVSFAKRRMSAMELVT